ncbi:MAG: AAA family ATPase [Verrucomicrobiota bacterium]
MPEIPGLDLIPSHLKLTFLDLDLAARPGRERIFARKLEKILPSYDVILCDCPPGLTKADPVRSNSVNDQFRIVDRSEESDRLG